MRCDIPGIKDGPPDSLFCLAPDWVYLAFIVTFEAVSSYLPFSPLPQASSGRLFSVTLSVTLGCPHAPPFSRGILPYGVRTFLSSKRQANAHTPRSTRGRCPKLPRCASGKFERISPTRFCPLQVQRFIREAHLNMTQRSPEHVNAPRAFKTKLCKRS